MWVVLIGPHCAGKSTVGKILAERHLHWIFDGEIGDTIVERSNPRSADQGGDDEILRLEAKRDQKRLGTNRVVETWHFGNAAWASFRNHDATANEMTDAATKAAAAAKQTIYCFGLECGEEEQRVRFNKLKESKKLCLGTQTLEETRRIGTDSQSIAQKILDKSFRTIITDGKSPTEVAEMIHCDLLDLVVGPSLLPHNFQLAKSSACEASQVVPVLLPSLPDWPETICAATEAFPGLVIAVEGIDGCGKTTLVERLQKHIGSQAVQSKSPPASLDNLRSVIESNPSHLSTMSAYGRFKRAFYTLGNYVCAKELYSMEYPVVLDRFVSSTLSYTFGAIDANEKETASLEPRAVWPEDMPKPDIVLVLEATEEVRMSRIQQRSQGAGVGVGEWEKESEKNPRLGPAILYHMKHITNGPRTLGIDANPNDHDQVFRQCASTLVDEGIAVVLRQVVPAKKCEAIIAEFQQVQQGKLPAKSFNRYKWEKLNTIYRSRRHSANVCFLWSERLSSVQKSICNDVSKATGRSGWSVQDDVLPVFSYKDGDDIKAHRDVNLTSLDDYCALLTVSKRGVDFEEGAFYVNEFPWCIRSVSFSNFDALMA